MRDTEVHPDAECRRGMRVSGGEGRGELEMGPGSRTEGEDGEAVSGCRIQPQLSPLLRHSAFLFCILHRGEIPHPAFISPLPTLPLKGAGFARWPLVETKEKSEPGPGGTHFVAKAFFLSFVSRSSRPHIRSH